MKSLVHHVCVLVLLLAFTAAAFAQSAEIRLKDGAKWRGKIGDKVELTYMQQGVEVPLSGKLTKVEDLFVVVEGDVAGRVVAKTLFKADIVTVKTVGAAADGSAGASPTSSANTAEPAAAKPASTPGSSVKEGAVHVFVLPMTGTVGVTLRYQELEQVVKEADKYGPGQIIVIEVDSPGGLVIEMEHLNRVFREGKRKHRMIAWIKEAISGGAATAVHCDEIYFMPEGTLGAMTMFSGTTSATGESLQRWLRTAGDFMKEGGRSPYIAHAMIDDAALLSYTKDPETGEVTWFDDLSGEVDLSNEKTNLVFTASTALASGFSDGTASTLPDLLEQLDLPTDFKVEQFGIELHKRWIATAERAEEEIPLLIAQLDYKGAAGGTVEFLGNQVKILKELIGWWDRAPNVARMSLPPKEDLERELEQLRKNLADIQRRR